MPGKTLRVCSWHSTMLQVPRQACSPCQKSRPTRKRATGSWMLLKRLVRPDLSHYSAHRPPDPPRSQRAASETTVVSGATHAVMRIPVNTTPSRRARHRAQQRRGGARGLPRGALVGIDIGNRKLAQVVVIACSAPPADIVVCADVGTEVERAPNRTHVRGLHQLGALL